VLSLGISREVARTRGMPRDRVQEEPKKSKKKKGRSFCTHLIALFSIFLQQN
jgi:hypothetical protein